jgi:hypothetical protein
MKARRDALLAQIKDLEKELIRESQSKEAEFSYCLRERKIEFNTGVKDRHRLLVKSLWRFLVGSRFLVLLTAPVIWACLMPAVFLDLVGSIYQAICFPVYGIPKVRRRDYIAFDRHHLAYLNLIEKLNCEYCAYVNGILAYFTEIAARTEQYWCPIRHAGCVRCAHSRYRVFVDFGDGERYRKELPHIRRSFDDVATPDGVPKKD